MKTPPSLITYQGVGMSHSHPISPGKKSANYDNLGDKSICSTTSDFTVHTGPPRLHSPLGVASSSTDHYIKPVPPTYVTEYEAAYQWPTSPGKKSAVSNETKSELC